MTARVYSIALLGLNGQIVEVEVDIRRGKNKVNIIGLPDKAVSEAKDRILPAIKNSNCIFPKGIITVNLAPADIPKFGSVYDLPIAVGILIASNQLQLESSDKIFVGEVSLEGSLRDTNGILSILDSGKDIGFKEFYVPSDNYEEASLVQGVVVYPVKNINELLMHFSGKIIHRPTIKINKASRKEDSKYNLKYIKGQYHAKRALEIAAAGGHNCLFNGVPGSGKTFLARCLPGILPDMTFDESIEVTRIYSVAGLLPKNKPLVSERPFRTPHHTLSQVALVGGGSFPKPGEVTLAHRGVLFLDEFSEFNTKSLEVLRQPLEDKIVTISRASGTITFPANFMLVAAMNPCKCGFKGDPDRECTCAPTELLKYQRKISGPVMDRIDLQVKVPKVKLDKLISQKDEEGNEVVRKRVQNARSIQLERFKHEPDIYNNSDMNQQMIKKYIKLNKASLELLKTAIDSLNLTARSYFRILKVARTIADLTESETVQKDHVAEALSYRM